MMLKSYSSSMISKKSIKTFTDRLDFITSGEDNIRPTLDTIKEISEALNNEEDFGTNISALIAEKHNAQMSTAIEKEIKDRADAAERSIPSRNYCKPRPNRM